jgi:hypothetical protein
MIRVEKQVYAELGVMKEAMERYAARGGLLHLDRSDRHGLTLSTVIAELIRRDISHRHRSNRRPRKAGEPAATADATHHTDE